MIPETPVDDAAMTTLPSTAVAQADNLENGAENDAVDRSNVIAPSKQETKLLFQVLAC